MAQVAMPQNQNAMQSGGLQKAMGLAQLIGGGMSGNPAMAGQGAMSLASTAGQGAGVDAVQAPNKISALNSNNPIQRRDAQNNISIEDKLSALQTAERILPTLPKEVSEEVGPPIYASMVNLAKEIRQTGYQRPQQQQGMA